jgi:hypothetical protein
VYVTVAMFRSPVDAGRTYWSYVPGVTIADVLHTWGYQATRWHARARLVGAQRHVAASTKPNGPRGTLELWVPFSEQRVESLIEDSATNLQ